MCRLQLISVSHIDFKFGFYASLKISFLIPVKAKPELKAKTLVFVRKVLEKQSFYQNSI